MNLRLTANSLAPTPTSRLLAVACLTWFITSCQEPVRSVANDASAAATSAASQPQHRPMQQAEPGAPGTFDLINGSVITEADVGRTLRMHVGETFRLWWHLDERRFSPLYVDPCCPDPTVLRAAPPPAPTDPPYPPTHELVINYTAIAPTATISLGRTVIRANSSTCVNLQTPCPASLTTLWMYVVVLP